MPIIKVQRLPGKKLNVRRLQAELCYYYPQYTLEAARRLSARDVFLLLREARRKEAVHYYNLTQIAAAPHSKKGAMVRKLSERYKDVINNG